MNMTTCIHNGFEARVKKGFAIGGFPAILYVPVKDRYGHIGTEAVVFDTEEQRDAAFDQVVQDIAAQAAVCTCFDGA